jgi:hypothetical protein
MKIKIGGLSPKETNRLISFCSEQKSCGNCYYEHKCCKFNGLLEFILTHDQYNNEIFDVKEEHLDNFRFSTFVLKPKLNIDKLIIEIIKSGYKVSESMIEEYNKNAK